MNNNAELSLPEPERAGAVVSLEQLIKEIAATTFGDDAESESRLPQGQISDPRDLTNAMDFNRLLRSRGIFLSEQFSVLQGTLNFLGADRGNPYHYARARAGIESISGTIDQIDRMVEDHGEILARYGKSLETLRRYERATRSTFQRLLDYLKREQEEWKIIGTFKLPMNRGESITLGPETVYVWDKEVSRIPLFREAYMLQEETPLPKKLLDALITMGRRFLTGESVVLDMYRSESDGHELSISSDELGGNLYVADLSNGPILARPQVYFGSRDDVMLRVESPLAKAIASWGVANAWSHFKKAAYGPSMFLQKFEPRKNGSNLEVIFQIEGDIELVKLDEGKTKTIDPRHAYAWDATVEYNLVRFGSLYDLILRDLVPYYVEFKGPGRLWISNKGFRDGYTGRLFMPMHWIHAAGSLVSKVVSYPLGLIK